MRRRRLLAALGAVTVASPIAGCLGDPDGPGGTRTLEPTTQPTEPTDTGPHPVTPAATTFEVRNRACGTGRSAATITVADDVVTVEGVIGGRDTCDTAQLAAVDLLDDVLTVSVEVVEEAHTETVACAQCLTDIEYVSTVTVPGTDSLTVRVVHHSADGEETVATADRP